MKKAYYYFYYKLYCFGVFLSDDAINEWKPLVTILVLELLLLIQILIWYTVYTKQVVVIAYPGLTFFPIVTLLGIGNYRFFLHQDKWKEYSKEFKAHSKKQKVTGAVIVSAVIVTIISSLIYSFYQLAQIN
jgi:hypothetical protein